MLNELLQLPKEPFNDFPLLRNRISSSQLNSRKTFSLKLEASIYNKENNK